MSDTSKLKYPQDYALNKCTIVTATGQPLDFTLSVLELGIYQDIYAAVMSGDILVSDTAGFLNYLSFSGNEFIILELGKPGGLDITVKKTFRIYKVSDRKLVSLQNEMYILHFCSEELLLSEQYKISKSYKGKIISDIVTDIFTTYLKVSTDKYNPNTSNNYIETTKGIYDFIIPNMKPLEAINWLSNYAISASPKTMGSPYLFFENNRGFNFKSLQELIQVPPIATFNYTAQNLNMPNDNRVTDMEYYTANNAIMYEFVKSFDAADSTMNGTFANKLIAIDPLDRNYTVNKFDYGAYSNTSVMLNGSGLMSNAQNRLAATANTVYDSVLKLTVTNTGESRVPYIQGHVGGAIHDINIEISIPNRTSQLSQIDTNKMKILIPGNPIVNVGDVITFNFLELNSDSSGRKNDKFYSGNYMITALRHKINQENGFVTLLEISKESMPNPYVDPDNTNPAWQKIRSQ